LDLDSSGRPAIAYYVADAADLKFARLVSGAWRVETFDAYHATGATPSLAFDTADRPAIAYFRKSSGSLRLARLAPAGCSIATVDASSPKTGIDPSLRLDPASHRLALSWHDRGNK